MTKKESQRDYDTLYPCEESEYFMYDFTFVKKKVLEIGCEVISCHVNSIMESICTYYLEVLIWLGVI